MEIRERRRNFARTMFAFLSTYGNSQTFLIIIYLFYTGSLRQDCNSVKGLILYETYYTKQEEKRARNYNRGEILNILIFYVEVSKLGIP